MSERLRVLIVEDNPANAELMSAWQKFWSRIIHNGSTKMVLSWRSG